MSRWAIALFASLLSRGYRERVARRPWPICVAATLTGVVELAGAAALFAVRLGAYQRALDARLDGAIGELDAVNYHIVVKPGLAGTLGFVLSPLGLGLIFLALEGLGRAASAAFFREPRGLTLVWLVEKVHAAGARTCARLWDRVRTGRVVADEVSRGGPDCDLQIASCRRRPWGQREAIEFEEALYVLASFVDIAVGPRRFVYRLNAMRAGADIQRIHHYSPDELMPRQL